MIPLHSHFRRRLRAFFLQLAGSLILLCCSSAGDPPKKNLTIFAASSLRPVFQALKKKFERHYPSIDVKLQFAGSQRLQLQISEGARPQLFATAHPRHVRALSELDLIDAPRPLAFGRLALAVPRKNPSQLKNFSDLARARCLLIAGPEVPVGRYARKFLERAEDQLGVALTTRLIRERCSDESSARLVRAKLLLAEADAGLIYESDLLRDRDGAPEPRLKRIPIPAELQRPLIYQIAPLQNLSVEQAEHVKHWFGLLKSQAGHSILKRFGFSPP